MVVEGVETAGDAWAGLAGEGQAGAAAAAQSVCLPCFCAFIGLQETDQLTRFLFPEVSQEFQQHHHHSTAAQSTRRFA